MKPISIHVSEPAYQELKALAAREGLPVAEIIRQAMSEYLEEHGGRRRSLLDVAPHPSGEQLGEWTRAEILEEMIG